MRDLVLIIEILLEISAHYFQRFISSKTVSTIREFCLHDVKASKTNLGINIILFFLPLGIFLTYPHPLNKLHSSGRP